MAEPEKKKRRYLDDDPPSSDDDAPDTDIMDGVSLNKLPAHDHPEVAKLDDLDFIDLPENFFVLFYGARRTGKTHALSCLLEAVKDRFDFAYLFSETSTLHIGEKGEANFDFIRDEAKFQGFDEDALNKIIERQILVKKFNNKCKYKGDQKPNKTLIIFDDFVHLKEVRYSQLFTQLPVLGRHMDLSVICLSQGYSAVGSSGLNPATRQNADLICTFYPRNVDDSARIAQWYLPRSLLEGMWFVNSVCREKHQLLAINLTDPSETDYVDFCTKYKAPEDIPKYQIGKVQWKLWREEKKRHKQAALESQRIQSAEYFINPGQESLGAGRLNEGTGSTMHTKGRISLYDMCHAQL